MQFQRINRSDPEKVFVSVRNNSATAATVGQVVAWDYTTDADGVSVRIPVAGSLTLAAGIVESASIAAEAFGLVQVYGHNANALVTGGADVTIGDPLILTTAKSFLSKATAVTNGAGQISYSFTAGQAFTTAGAAAKKVFVKCL
jgi:hypothetical protein